MTRTADPLAQAIELQRKLAGEITVTIPLALLQELIAEIQLLKQINRGRKPARQGEAA